MATSYTSGLNDINDIPKAWKHALAAVQVSFPDAVIAGGCLRDREHGVKVKDIDIFISTSASPELYGTLGTIKSRLERDGWADVQICGDESYNADATKRGVVAVLDMTYPGAPPVQLIALKHFTLEEFDFGICQIMFDGKRIVRTRDYHLDMAKQKFRVVPKVDDDAFVRIINRWARLKEKYPTWSFDLGSRSETAPQQVTRSLFASTAV